MSLLEKAILCFTKRIATSFTKIQFGGCIDGRAIGQTGKPLQIKDKLQSQLFLKVDFIEQQKAANREGNRTGGGEL